MIPRKGALQWSRGFWFCYNFHALSCEIYKQISEFLSAEWRQIIEEGKISFTIIKFHLMLRSSLLLQYFSITYDPTPFRRIYINLFFLPFDFIIQQLFSQLQAAFSLYLNINSYCSNSLNLNKFSEQIFKYRAKNSPHRQFFLTCMRLSPVVGAFWNRVPHIFHARGWDY